MEGVATALCKIMEMERAISGDDKTVAIPNAGAFQFMRERILGDREQFSRNFIAEDD